MYIKYRKHIQIRIYIIGNKWIIAVRGTIKHLKETIIKIFIFSIVTRDGWKSEPILNDKSRNGLSLVKFEDIILLHY